MNDGEGIIDLNAERARRAAETGFHLTLSFEGRPNNCPTCGEGQFVLGVEVGILLARLEAKPTSWRGTYHTANQVMIERVAQARGYVAKVEPSPDSSWLFIDFTPASPGPVAG